MVVAPDINIDPLGKIIDFDKTDVPTVRDINLPFLSYFSRFSIVPRDENRTMLPDLMREIESQTKGELRMDNFISTSCTNVHCDVMSISVVMEDGSLFPWAYRVMDLPKDTCWVATKNRKEISNQWWYIDECMGGEEGAKGFWDEFL
jgi:hypothetical protein